MFCFFSLFFKRSLSVWLAAPSGRDHKMACGKPISSFSIFMTIFMVVFVSVVHSSRTRLQGGVPADDKAIPTQDLESHLVKSLVKGASSVVAEDSAREVPTGPDPLHHNNHPTKP
ncbi:hypothetical protein MANES_14G014000v8 [Manihot esculenta]|uniref:Uncharacterized protein n=1 Tax=Manihot esculenta TaxID=3983 RepID=A0A2C9UHT8_MANES|nr:hypothetical protein MANES_14G014000v8 [Manihot esculenta]